MKLSETFIASPSSWLFSSCTPNRTGQIIPTADSQSIDILLHPSRKNLIWHSFQGCDGNISLTVLFRSPAVEHNLFQEIHSVSYQSDRLMTHHGWSYAVRVEIKYTIQYMFLSLPTYNNILISAYLGGYLSRCQTSR